VEDYLKELSDLPRCDYVLTWRSLKDGANTILPLLDAHERRSPTRVAAGRLDYFDVADELGKIAPCRRRPMGTNLPPRAPNPPFAAEQEIWIKKVSPRPWPKARARSCRS